jgi:hypothetical protein
MAEPATTSRTRPGWGAARSKEVRWHDPAVLAAEAARLSGREFLQGIIDGRLPPPPIAELLGLRLVTVGDGEALVGRRMGFAEAHARNSADELVGHATTSAAILSP